jgi:putative ABC transport system permease protein
LGITFFAGVVGGSYPAFYLSGFNPVNVLKGKLAARGGSVFFRRALVVLQFSISIFMLISTLVVFDQLSYMRNKDLGFDKERVVRLTMSERELRQKIGCAGTAVEANTGSCECWDVQRGTRTKH